MNHFKVITITPLYLSNIEIPIATIRNNGIALLDMEFCPDHAIVHAAENLTQFLKQVGTNTSFGLRFATHQLSVYQSLENQLKEFPHILLLSGLFNKDDATKTINNWTQNHATLWAEILDGTSLDEYAKHEKHFDALVAKGNESGGCTGNDSAFILSQKVLKKTTKQFYIQGGIGIHTAAACRAAGAAGVVLDDQLLLLHESPLSFEQKEILKNISAEQTLVLNMGNKNIRVAGHPTFKQLQHYKSLSQTKETSSNQEIIYWGSPENSLWPVGQAVGMADFYHKKYKKTGIFIRELLAKSLECLLAAQDLQPLQQNSLLAVDHGTAYPIVQGPMTRVSDIPEFIDAVATNGALPLAAIAMMKGPKANELLQETKNLLGNKSWGAGVLGFIDQDLMQEQFEVIAAHKPSFVLIAGGSYEQTLPYENLGIKTYIHAPVPKLLQIFYRRGAKRFVLEGRECGGHIGPLSSFSLWESAIETLLAEPNDTSNPANILFAGGIHDALSAAMVSAMSGTLTAKGINIGVLMGTAYLFTQEACSTGAVVTEFQQKVIDCSDTHIIETGPGHAIRCVHTPYVDEFNGLRNNGIKNNTKPEELSKILEKSLLGRLRIASKGLTLNPSGELIAATQKMQTQEGLYMTGKAAEINTEIITIKELHTKIIEQSVVLLNAASNAIKETVQPQKQPSDIAIIGMSVLVPGAQEHAVFWENIVKKVSQIKEIPNDVLDWRMYYDANIKAKDKMVSKWGAFIDEVLFDPLRFGIPPQSLKYISPGQLLLLEAVQKAIDDCGFADSGFDNKHTSVIIGSDGSSKLKGLYEFRSSLPQYINNIDEKDLDRLPEWNEESFPGILTNVLAGRVANRFNLGGANFSVDAACASSLAALDLAVKELEFGDSNMVIAGGVDIAQSAYSYMAFSKTHALSPTGESMPFDATANGIVLSEGVSVVVLKRLEDAKRDGDRIYSVIKGTGSSSDGKALGLTAPRSGGQEQAFNRAYHKANISPATLGYYEAHATGTTVGDQVELDTITAILDKAGAATHSCAIGSLKSILGHTKTCAGILGVIKGTLSLYHKTLPPHPIKTAPISALKPNSPAFILNEGRPWFTPKENVRRLGVSAFGFGGTNSHVVLEEYQNTTYKQANGADKWPCELFVFNAQTAQELKLDLDNVLKSFQDISVQNLLQIAPAFALKAKKNQNAPVRLSIVATDLQDLKNRIETVIEKINGNTAALPAVINLELTPAVSPVSFVFPGQGAQYLNMAREIALYFPQMRSAIEEAAQLFGDKTNLFLDKIIYPAATYTQEDEEIQRKELTHTHHAQIAIGAVSAGFLDIFKALQLVPDSVAGHSFGELTALHASGIIDRTTFFELAETRGRLMANVTSKEGTMAVVFETPETVKAILQDEVVIANYNAPKQTIISGRKTAIEDMLKQFAQNGIKAIPLEVSGPFHSPLYNAVQIPFNETIQKIQTNPAAFAVFSNTSALPYPETDAAIKDVLKKHLLSPVHFSQQILNMYENGTRIFIEVGPKNIMKGLIGQILEEKEHLALSAYSQTEGLKGLLTLIGKMYSLGYSINLPALFENRTASQENVDDILKNLKTKPIPATAFYVTGSGVRSVTEDKINIARLPAINLEERARINQNTPPNQNMATHKTITNDSSLVAGFEAYQATMRDFLTTQERVLAQFLGNNATTPTPQQLNYNLQAIPEQKEYQTEIENVPETNTIVAPEKEEKDMVSVHSQKINRSFLTQIILDFLVERTGYPKEVFEPQLDLESELGIDSIKRVEMLDNVLKALPLQWSEQLHGDMPKLMRTKTIDMLLDIICAVSIEDEPQIDTNTEPVEEKTLSYEVSVESDCPRFLMKAEHRELPFLTEEIRLNGLYLIMADEFGIASTLAQRITDLGGKPVVLDYETLSSSLKIEKAVSDAIRTSDERISIIHLSAIAKSLMPEHITDWRLLTQIQSKSLFQTIITITKHLEVKDIFPVQAILAGSMFGGSYGRNERIGPGLPPGGGNIGLLNALKKEWDEVAACTVDFDSSLSVNEITNRILRELNQPENNAEIGYPEGERIVYKAIETKVKSQATKFHDLKIDKDWVVIATGGAKGITAEICKSIAQPGMKFILVGRSEKPDNDFADFKAKGVEVSYKSADVRNEAQFGALIKEIYSDYGRIDAVLHGAGIIDDRSIINKSITSFDNVFDTKADSAFILNKYLNFDTLKLMVFFSSVSGRFGNQGQTDYAAANEVLNRFAWYLRNKWPKLQVMSINWGPWSEVGMASSQAINLLNIQGIKQISAKKGTDFFINEINNYQSEMVELIAGDGPWRNTKNKKQNEIYNPFVGII
jgi:acyl transferase domain-containing protein/NAD(P)H-dependent flavin oxidoreductase YrpB (nitropropane dioxygenase family)/NAD(P)-dependent dehydrogenase (short-subunit alcohol dehydrogenase family)